MRWIFEAFRGRLLYQGRSEEIRVRMWRHEFGRRVVRPTIEQVRAKLCEQDVGCPAGMNGWEGGTALVVLPDSSVEQVVSARG